MLLAALVLPLPLAAQGPAAGVAEPPRVGCLRGRPLPTCKTFWIIEMQAETPVMQSRRIFDTGTGYSYSYGVFEDQLEWNVGHMVNVSPSTAVGGVLSAGTASGSTISGVKVRGRRWLRTDISLELEGGLRRRESWPGPASGLTVGGRLNIRDHGAFYLRWDGLDIPADPYLISVGGRNGGFYHALSVGAGLGSVPALIGSGAVGLAMLIFIAALGDSWD